MKPPNLPISVLPPLNPSQVVALSNRHALLSQDSIRHANMEVEVGDGKVKNVVLGRHLHLASPSRHDNLSLVVRIHHLRIHSLEHRDGLLDALLQLGECGFVVFHGDRCNTSDTHGNAFGGVAHSLDLVGERGHVGDEPGFDEDRLVGGGVEAAFLEEFAEDLEVSDEDRDDRVVESDSHGD